MAIVFLTEQSRTMGSGVAPLTVKQEEMNQRVADGTILFLQTIVSPMQAQKAADALRKQQGFNGKVMKRCAWVHENFWNIASVDHAKGRVSLKNGSFYTFRDLTKTTVDYIEWLMAHK